MFFEPFDRGAERISDGAVVQVRAAAGETRGGVVRDDYFREVEARAFVRGDGRVAYGMFTEGEDLVQFRLVVAVHIQDAGGSAEKFGEAFAEFDHDFVEGTVLENAAAEVVPGIHGENQFRCGVQCARVGSLRFGSFLRWSGLPRSRLSRGL